MKNTLFSPPALIMVLICAVLLFAASVLLPALDDRAVATGPMYAPGSFSSSAIGHAGLYDVLRRLERPVERAVGHTLSAVGEKGALIVAEPEMRYLDDEDALRLLQVPRLLLVLPKWRGVEDERRDRWIGRATPRPIKDAQTVLGLVTGEAWLDRAQWPLDFTVNELPFTPAGFGRVQLIRSAKLRPIVGTAEAMLVGELITGGQRVWVLSDPDIMANHGLGLGQNAAFMVSLLDALRLSDGGGTDAAPIVFDETVHGFQAPEWSPGRLLFRLPFAAVTMVTLAAALMMILAGCGRFGALRPAKRALDFGKLGLIANGARLLEHAGHQGVTLESYIKMTLYSTALALHAPARLNEAGLLAWLDRLGRGRNVATRVTEIMGAVSEIHDTKAGSARLYRYAREIYKWKGDIVHGSGTGRINRQ